MRYAQPASENRDRRRFFLVAEGSCCNTNTEQPPSKVSLYEREIFATVRTSSHDEYGWCVAYVSVMLMWTMSAVCGV